MTRCYLVQVRTTNANQNTVQFTNGSFCKCENGHLYVTTVDPTLIFAAIGAERVVSVTDIGFGYHMMAIDDPKGVQRNG